MDLIRWNRIRYTVWSPFYDLIARHLAPLRRRSIALADIRPGERVLLVGAGTGLDLPFFAPGVKITATDLTPSMLERLKQRATKLGLSVNAQVADAQELPFPDGSYDVVVMHFIVAVIPDPFRCVREAARVLKSGGRAVILDKFVPDEGPVPLKLRLLNPITHVLATELTRRLGPILKGSGLRISRQESLALGSYVKAVLLTKD